MAKQPSNGLLGNNPLYMTPGAGQAISTLYSQPAQFANILGGNYGSYVSGLGSLGKSYADAYSPYAGAVGNVAQSQAGMQAAAANAMGMAGRGYSDAYGAYAQGLGNLAQSQAAERSAMYGAQGSAVGGVAQARANENAARYGANAMAEAARQGALANLGSASLGAYGSASNAALAAWAANQQAYSRSAADMHMANQQSMANLGVSRNNAIGGLGSAYGDVGKAQVGANALSNINFSGSFPGMGGGGGGSGFSATGPGGSQIASGSYGGTGGAAADGGGAFSLTGSRSSSQSGEGGAGALSGLSALRESLDDKDIANRIDRASQAGRNQLDNQHYSSRGMPSQMLGQTLGGLMTLSAPAYGSIASGMNQFYGNNVADNGFYDSAMSTAQRMPSQYDSSRGSAIIDALTAGLGSTGDRIGDTQSKLDRLSNQSFSPYLGALGSGYGTAVSGIDNTRGAMGSGFTAANSGVMDLWNNSFGKFGEFQTPAEREIAARQGSLESSRSQEMERLARFERLSNDPASPYRNYYGRQAAAQRARMGA